MPSHRTQLNLRSASREQFHRSRKYTNDTRRQMTSEWPESSRPPRRRKAFGKRSLLPRSLRSQSSAADGDGSEYASLLPEGGARSESSSKGSGGKDSAASSSSLGSGRRGGSDAGDGGFPVGLTDPVDARDDDKKDSAGAGESPPVGPASPVEGVEDDKPANRARTHRRDESAAREEKEEEEEEELFEFMMEGDDDASAMDYRYEDFISSPTIISHSQSSESGPFDGCRVDVDPPPYDDVDDAGGYETDEEFYPRFVRFDDRDDSPRSY